MNSDDLRAIRDETGVPYMSLYGLRIQIRQLRESPIPCPWRTALKVLVRLHPLLMQNLKIDHSGQIELKDWSMVWERRKGWVGRI